MDFNCYIAIDWSGAQGNNLPGLQVAKCDNTNNQPELKTNNGNGWLREGILQFLNDEHNKNGPLLIGIDFAFAYPFCDKLAYFPGHQLSPDSAFALWQLIDIICQNDNDFHGRTFFHNEKIGFREYLNLHNYQGNKYDNNRFRITETMCSVKHGVHPSCDFNCVGPASVGIGSIAGMRFLHAVRTEYRDSFTIWPFESLNPKKSVIVEIFPRLFKNNHNNYGINQNFINQFNNQNEHVMDAIVSAQAIKNIAGNENYRKPKYLNDCCRKYEGWIFGV